MGKGSSGDICREEEVETTGSLIIYY